MNGCHLILLQLWRRKGFNVNKFMRTTFGITTTSITSILAQFDSDRFPQSDVCASIMPHVCPCIHIY